MSLSVIFQLNCDLLEVEVESPSIYNELTSETPGLETLTFQVGGVRVYHAITTAPHLK
jgi:hypothetical protein